MFLKLKKQMGLCMMNSNIKTKNQNLFYKDANLLILVIELTVRALESWFREACDNGAGNVLLVIIGNKKVKEKC